MSALGRPLGSTSKFHLGGIYGGSTLLAVDRVKSEISNSIKTKTCTMECSCGSIFEIHYSILSHILKYTDTVTCGCKSTDGVKREKHKLQKKLESAAEEVTINYLKNPGKQDRRDQWLKEILNAYKSGNYGENEKKLKNVTSKINHILFQSDRNISVANRKILEDIKRELWD